MREKHVDSSLIEADKIHLRPRLSAETVEEKDLGNQM